MLNYKQVVTTFCLVFASTTTLDAQNFKKPLAKLDLKNGDAVVFLGDSITHQCLYTQYVEDYFYTRHPGMRLKFHNAGVGGATAWDALARFDKDVAAYKPKYVTVLLGMNDGRYRPFDKAIFETYRRDMTEVIERIRKAGATPVLITPTMFDSRAARLRRRRNRNEDMLQQYNGVLAYYGAWLREVAVDKGYGFVDMYSRLNNATLGVRKRDAKFTLIKDSVHPDPPGQLVMAYSILHDLVPRDGVSSIFIARSGPMKAIAKSTGGKLANPKFSPTHLEFTFQAKHLPWIVPAEAAFGVKLLRLPATVNREVLQVLGLAKGHYELTIDGETVGTFSNNSYFRGLQLHNSKKTPQYKQALQIANLNKKRNDGPVKSLRNEWRTFQTWARLNRQLENSPDDKKLADRVAALKKQLEGLDERIAKHKRAAREIEDKIFEINKPRPRKYVVKKVSLASVEGTVTLDGKPLEGAVVRFRGSNGETAVGKTDAQGRYRMLTDGLPGVKAGEYRAAISKTLGNSAAAVAPKGLNPREIIPPRYSDLGVSALKVVVPEEGSDALDFHLKSR